MAAFIDTGKLTGNRLIVISSAVLVLFYNFTFFKHFTDVYPLVAENIAFILSVCILLFTVTALLLSVVGSRYTIKPILIFIFICSSLASYFMDSYNIIVDSTMIKSIMMTDSGEAADLLEVKLLMYVLILGLSPAILIYRAKLHYGTVKYGLVSKLKFIVLLVVVIIAQLLMFGKSYAAFFREHKDIRYYTNPVTYIYSIEKYIKTSLASHNLKIEPVGLDAHLAHFDEHRELTIIVVGETVRADRLSLNGYHKNTTPLLEKENVISLTNMHSCGTSTAVSVPCMFSMHNRDDYDDVKGAGYENLLDVVTHAGIHVLWRDNNSDSKGVALRVLYQDYKSPDINHMCDVECRDVGMLEGLQEYIDGVQKGDILIILHQMGSHGPAYYKRYPESFEKFTPVCKTSHLEACTEEQINNAYDNTILYSDYFLSRVIELLKQNVSTYKTALLYVSDHGESLGEKGVYLHGLPNMLAPDAQTHVASLLWFGDNYDEISVEDVRKRAGRDFSHDNIFHTVLGLMEVETDVYNRGLDIIFSDI